MSITDRIILEKENVRLTNENRQLKNEVKLLRELRELMSPEVNSEHQ
jgi:cell division protein FtsB